MKKENDEIIFVFYHCNTDKNVENNNKSIDGFLHNSILHSLLHKDAFDAYIFSNEAI